MAEPETVTPLPALTPIGMTRLWHPVQGVFYEFNPRDNDITTFELALLLNLAIALMRNGSNRDWPSYLDQYSLWRHFKVVT